MMVAAAVSGRHRQPRAARKPPPRWLPGTATASLPDDVRAAWSRTCAASDDQEVFGNAVRRLNSDLLRLPHPARPHAAAPSAMPRRDAAIDLAAIDPRWGEPRFWAVIKAAMPRYTDRNLLAAVDLRRDPSGSIVAEAAGAVGQPPDHAAHLPDRRHGDPALRGDRACPMPCWPRR